jgi:hypothetical protein
VLGRGAVEDGSLWRIRLDQGEIRFVNETDGRGEGLGAFDVAVRDVKLVHARAAARGLIDNGTVMLAGTRVRLIHETARSE